MNVTFNSNPSVFFSESCSVECRRDIHEIFTSTPYDKQVMMFTATLPTEAKTVCLKYMNNVRNKLIFKSQPLCVEIDDKVLTLHGLKQYVLHLQEVNLLFGG